MTVGGGWAFRGMVGLCWCDAAIMPGEVLRWRAASGMAVVVVGLSGGRVGRFGSRERAWRRYSGKGRARKAAAVEVIGLAGRNCLDRSELIADERYAVNRILWRTEINLLWS